MSVVFCTFQGQSTHFIPLIVSEKAKDTKAQPFLFQVLLNIISKSEKVTSDLTATDAEVKTPLNGDQKNPLPPLPLMRSWSAIFIVHWSAGDVEAKERKGVTLTNS